ncbi:MAG: glycosyltransferase family 87 protein [Micromonosporaceae bacterium]
MRRQLGENLSVQDRPSQSDPVVRGLSEPFGGPVGEHAAEPRHRFWTPVRVVLALAVLVFVAHWIQKSPCQDGAWANLNQYKQFCYTDVLALYYGEGLGDGKVPYADHPVEYPVLTGAFMGLIGLPVNALGDSSGGAVNEGQWFYNLSALALCLLGLATVATILAMRGGVRHREAAGLASDTHPGAVSRPWDAAMLALAPGVLLSATVNWDLLVISLAAFAIYAWSREKPAFAGVLLGLAVAAKFYPLLILGPLFLLGLRARRLTEVVITAAAGVLTWLAINVPVAVLWPEGWARFFSFNSERGVDWGTLWYVGVHFPRGAEGSGFELFEWFTADSSRLNNAWVALFALCCAGIAVLAFAAPRRPRLAQLVFLVVACFLLVNKVWSQQFVLWLIPLVVLARPRWGAFLAWQAAEVLYFLTFYGTLIMASGGDKVFPDWVFILTSLGRIGTLLALVVLVVREVLRPELDVVRRHGVDDPDGGVFDGARDQTWVALLGARLRRTAATPS